MHAAANRVHYAVRAAAGGVDSRAAAVFRQRDYVMLQLRYGDVSNASEEPNLMVDEEESGIVGREPFLVSFLFHSFLFVRCAVPTGTIIALTII